MYQLKIDGDGFEGIIAVVMPTSSISVALDSKLTVSVRFHGVKCNAGISIVGAGGSLQVNIDSLSAGWLPVTWFKAIVITGIVKAAATYSRLASVKKSGSGVTISITGVQVQSALIADNALTLIFSLASPES